MKISSFVFSATLIFLFFLQNYATVQAKSNREAYIKIILPEGGEVFEEGQVCFIRWESRAVEKVYIAVAVGGKERGLLEGAKAVDAVRGAYTWPIPQGFITGFGINRADNVRIMVFDAKDSTIRDVSRCFTIEGRAANNNILDIKSDEYTLTILVYFSALSKRQYRLAYEMLSPCRIVLYNSDSSALAFQARGDYGEWLKKQKAIDEIRVIGIRRLNIDKDDALRVLGIKRYEVNVALKLHRENAWPLSSGRHSLVVTVVKGTDSRIRILDISGAP